MNCAPPSPAPTCAAPRFLPLKASTAPWPPRPKPSTGSSTSSLRAPASTVPKSNSPRPTPRPFRRLKFKLKREIITFRNATVDPTRPGQYVDPAAWNALLADPEVLLLDTRNTYETAIGTFAGATTPPLDTFSDFSDYVQKNLDPAKHRKVAMFCTGGIRCEKASAYMLQQGFPEVFHLKGGILKYLERIPEHQSQWQGACYIFDERVSVDHEDFSR